MMHDLSRFDRQLVRLVTEDGLKLKGFADYYSADYGRDEFGVEEESLRLHDYQNFEKDILQIEPLGLWYRFEYFQRLRPEELYAILKARVDVFVVEQNCPYAELDDRDQDAIHIWLEDKDGIAAYLRLLRPGVEHEYAALGRVLTLRRGRGLGRLLLSLGIDAAESEYGAEHIYLEAQTYAKGFYEKAGFRQVSGEFMVDGIPHIGMVRDSTVNAK